LLRSASVSTADSLELCGARQRRFQESSEDPPRAISEGMRGMERAKAGACQSLSIAARSRRATFRSGASGLASFQDSRKVW
jgi:hypothetical protein